MKIIEQFEPSFNDSVTTQWSYKIINYFIVWGEKRRKLTGLRQYTYTVTIYNNLSFIINKGSRTLSIWLKENVSFSGQYWRENADMSNVERS